MTSRKALLLWLLIVVMKASVAQGSDPVPTPVIAAFKTQYPAAQEVVYKDNLITINVHFTLDSNKLTASYTRKGKWKDTEKDWAFSKLPEDVKDGFDKSKYAAWTVAEAKIVYRPGGVERYRIKAAKNDVQKKYLFFNKNGQLLEDVITL